MAKDDSVVEFDAGQLNMEDLEDFWAALRVNKYRDAAVVMAKCCVKCPPEWGASDAPETFSKRPVRGKWAWRDLVRVMMASVNDTGE
jgi:hypothetical protein